MSERRGAPRRMVNWPRRLAAALADLCCRFLGLLVGARRGAFVGGAALGFIVWLALVHLAVTEATPVPSLAAVLFPLLLVQAGRWLLDLPPGVVFRAVARERPGVGVRSARCLASALFLTERGPRWRLLARSSVAVARDGTLRLVSPPALGSGPAVARAFPARGRGAFPAGTLRTMGGDGLEPAGLDARRWGGGYASPSAYAAAEGELMLRRAALVDVTPGWQYGRLHRWPALRLTYREPDDLATAYLAFHSREQVAWLLTRLTR